MISGYWIELFSGAGISAIVSLGLYLQMSSGQTNVGQAAFVGIGGYCAGLLAVKAGVPFGWALLFGALASALVGFLFSIVVLRLSHWWFAIASLAFGQAMVSLAYNIDYIGGILGLMRIPIKTTFWVIYAILILVILFFIGIEKSRFNFGVRAISSDEVASMTTGVNPKMIRIFAFTLGAFLGGLGGGLQVHHLSVITPMDMSFHISLNYFINVAVGGTKSFWGTLIAAYLLLFLPELLRFSAADRFIIVGILIVVVMIFLPQGLSGLISQIRNRSRKFSNNQRREK